MFSDLGRQAMEYLRDAQQRSVLYLDVMRRRSTPYSWIKTCVTTA